METTSKEYRINQNDFSTPKKLLLRNMTFVSSLFAAILIANYFTQGAEAAFAYVLPLAVAFCIILYSSYRTLSNYWRSYKLVLKNDGAIHCSVHSGEETIQREEITQIFEEPINGLLVKTAVESRTIGIPHQLIGYEEVRQQLALVKPIDARSGSASDVLPKIMIPIAISMALYSSSRPLISMLGSLLLIATILYAWQWLKNNFSSTKQRTINLLICAFVGLLQVGNVIFQLLKHFGKISP